MIIPTFMFWVLVLFAIPGALLSVFLLFSFLSIVVLYFQDLKELKRERG